MEVGQGPNWGSSAKEKKYKSNYICKVRIYDLVLEGKEEDVSAQGE
jgi:hypothetical protein